MQCIITKYFGPTNHRGSRVIAQISGGRRLTVVWDYEFDSDTNHTIAARALADLMGWSGEWIGATLNERGNVYVRVAPRLSLMDFASSKSSRPANP